LITLVVKALGLVFFCLFSLCFGQEAGKATPAVVIASLTDPAKLATPSGWREVPAFN